MHDEGSCSRDDPNPPNEEAKGIAYDWTEPTSYENPQDCPHCIVLGSSGRRIDPPLQYFSVPLLFHHRGKANKMWVRSSLIGREQSRRSSIDVAQLDEIVRSGLFI